MLDLIESTVVRAGSFPKRIRQTVHLRLHAFDPTNLVDELGIVQSTYRNHLKSIRDRLGIRSIRELLRLASPLIGRQLAALVAGRREDE